MTAPISTVPAARVQLFTRITSTINDVAVLVCYDDPGPNVPDDIVSVGRVERQVTPRSMVGSGGAGWLYETYTVEIIVSAFRGGDDSRTVFERCVSLSDSVIEAVRSDPSLGGVVLVARPSLWVYQSEWDDEHKGRVATAVGQIECEASI